MMASIHTALSFVGAIVLQSPPANYPNAIEDLRGTLLPNTELGVALAVSVVMITSVISLLLWGYAKSIDYENSKKDFDDWRGY